MAKALEKHNLFEEIDSRITFSAQSALWREISPLFIAEPGELLLSRGKECKK